MREVFMTEVDIEEIARDMHRERRGNCAMSVAYAYAVALGKTEEEAMALAQEFSMLNAGRAPGGLCGAIHTARTLMPEHADEIEREFREGAKGAATCREIRGGSIIPC
ncbi:MAG: hypothetical protein HUK21_03730, partial [Fibrobacteraceae bacterium]|nr:hypothetical protein [Fibrobacteraceae bacterium]